MRMNAGLNYQVRQGARNIRSIYAGEGGLDAMREAKEESLRSIYRILCIHLGNPPANFDWQWKDKDGEFHRDGALTPLEFAEKYIATPMEEYVCLVHDPRSANPPGRTYTVQYLGNVVDGARIKYLNVDIELMKDIAMRMLQDGTPVWMGCDTGKQMHRDKGLWDAELFDYASVYNADFSMNKEERLEYHQTAMTHAMLFTGVDVVDGKPRRWRVEKQLGRQGGPKGLLPDERFLVREYMFEIAAPKSYLPKTSSRPSTWSRWCCRRGTRWDPWRGRRLNQRVAKPRIRHQPWEQMPVIAIFMVY